MIDIGTTNKELTAILSTFWTFFSRETTLISASSPRHAQERERERDALALPALVPSLAFNLPYIQDGYYETIQKGLQSESFSCSLDFYYVFYRENGIIFRSKTFPNSFVIHVHFNFFQVFSLFFFKYFRFFFFTKPQLHKKTRCCP